MRRFVMLFVLLLFSIPFGVSISGCSHNVATPTFCNGGDTGPVTGQAAIITLNPVVYGISLNYAQIGQVTPPVTTDCKGNGVSESGFTYGTTDMTIADVQPITGRLCAGTWNRNTGGGIADYTYCTATNKTGTAYITASASGVASNPLPVFVHPVVTSIALGNPSACTVNPSTGNFNDPATNCCPLTTVGSPTAAQFYTASACVSQGNTVQLAARVYAGTGASQTNISCQAGHLFYSVQSATGSAASSVVSIDSNGVATANQPGSVLVSADIANAASSAGFFSTCPPASITLSAPGTTSNPIIVNQNTPQPLIATAVDTNGVALTGLSLEYVSTAPSTIQASSSLDPSLAGAASITALCQPPGCNSSAYNQIGLFGNGKPVSSNSLNVTAPGTNSTVLFMASTKSQYIEARDFTQSGITTPVLLPYVPNSMVISSNGSTIYMGSSTAFMVVNASGNPSISRVDTTHPGSVIGISPDGTMIVISDPVRQITTLESDSGTVISTYGGVGTHAEFSPDSQTAYITAGNQLLVYSQYTGWTSITPATPGGTPVTDVAVTVPGVGAYFAGLTTTARGYCPSSTATTVGGVTTETNVFYPPADNSAATTDRIAATNDGKHILGATVQTAPATLSDLQVTIPIGPCPMGNQTTNGSGTTTGTTGGLTFSSTYTTKPLPGVTANAINGILPTSDSSLAVITYTGSGGVLPYYLPSTGTISSIPLSSGATAPLSGAISSDNSTIYVGTSGDNLVHIINRSTLTDSSTLAPNLIISPTLVTPTLPATTIVPVDLLVQKPRSTT